jgi:hypothetical protein
MRNSDMLPSLTSLDEGFSSATILGAQMSQEGLEDPFDWSFEANPLLPLTEAGSGGNPQSTPTN